MKNQSILKKDLILFMLKNKKTKKQKKGKYIIYKLGSYIFKCHKKINLKIEEKIKNINYLRAIINNNINLFYCNKSGELSETN